MKDDVLVIIDSDTSQIAGWLVGEEMASLPEHIKNGYPDLADGFAGGTIKGQKIKPAADKLFKADHFEIKNGNISEKIQETT